MSCIADRFDLIYTLLLEGLCRNRKHAGAILPWLLLKFGLELNHSEADNDCTLHCSIF